MDTINRTCTILYVDVKALGAHGKGMELEVILTQRLLRLVPKFGRLGSWPLHNFTCLSCYLAALDSSPHVLVYFAYFNVTGQPSQEETIAKPTGNQPVLTPTPLHFSIRSLNNSARNKRQIFSPTQWVIVCATVTDVQYSSFFRKKLTVCPACQLALFSAWEVLAPLWMI